MALTRVSPALFQVSNNITSVTVGGSANTISLTFDSNGVITGASNNAVSVANTAITGNIISSQIAPSVTLTTPIISGNLNLDSVGTTGIRVPSANAISFHTAGTEDVRIDANGNVGIGTSSPSVKLDVVNSSTSGTGAVTTFRLNHPGTTAGDGPRLLFTSGESTTGGCAIAGSGVALNSAAMLFYAGGNTERFRITSNGGLSQNGDWGTNASTALRNAGAAANKFWQSGPDSNNNYIIYNQAGTGAYIVDGGTSWQFVSDETVKENLVPIQDAMTKVATLRTVIGNYINDENKTKHPFLIAQDVQAVLPEATNLSPEGKLGMSYTDVIPLLVASIKELKIINDTQAATITALTARIVALES